MEQRNIVYVIEFEKKNQYVSKLKCEYPSDWFPVVDSVTKDPFTAMSFAENSKDKMMKLVEYFQFKKYYVRVVKIETVRTVLDGEVK